MRTGTVKFFNESRLRIHYKTKKQEKILFMLQESTRKNYEGDRVSYEEEEGRKGKVAESSSYLQKIIFAYECLKTLFGTFFCINLKITP
jgi:CspA family cold shock protein